MTTDSKSCGACGHTVSDQARFCERCGAALRQGAEPLRAPDSLAEKILGQRSAIEGERKQVTVMFTDIVRSMELTRTLETERWGLVLDRFLAIACGAIHELEGTVNQFTGDGLMAVFGAPLAHEDHARRACLAVLELQSRIAPFAAELAESDGAEFSIRCGLNSGEVIVGEIGDDLHMDFTPIGNTTGMGKRIESLAPEGSTALSSSTASLVEGEFEIRELGEFEIKGSSEPQRVFELLGPGTAHTRLEAAAAHGLSRFVGRDDERDTLTSALERALAGEGRIVGVRGEPGVGKSRLVHEFARDCRDRALRVNTGRAIAHARAVPLFPVLGMLREFFGVGERDSPDSARQRIEAVLLELDPSFESELPLLFDFLGVPDPDRPLARIDPDARQRRLLAFVGRLVEARSRREPAVIVVEDLHWIDPASATFLEALVDAVAGTRTLLVVTYRPEYQAGWAAVGPYEGLTLAPLDAEASGELLEELLGSDPSLNGLDELIQGRTRGNPFFIEEAVSALAESGRLAGERGAYRLVGTIEELVLPPTVQAVLAARIDRLGGREKALVQTMSVVGEVVPDPVLREVSDLNEPELADATTTLLLAELLAETRSSGDREFAFKHPLTREVAYTSQLSAPRARAHAAVAEAIERVYPDGLDERAALVAHHWEAAGDMLKAAQWHGRAAGWISASSSTDGMSHWRRVRELSDELEASPEAEQLAVLARISILTLAWRVGMSHAETAAIHAEVVERLARSGRAQDSPERVLLDLAYAATVFFGGREREGLELARATSSAAERIGNSGIILMANGIAASAAWTIGSFQESFDLADRAISHAGDDVGAGVGLMANNPYAACLWMRAQSGGCNGLVDRAWPDFERSIQIAEEHGDAETALHALSARAHLRADVGELESGLIDVERAADLAEQSGNNMALVVAFTVLARIRGECGQFSAAHAAAERALAQCGDQGTGQIIKPEALAWLAAALLGLRDYREALRQAQRAVAIAERRMLKRGMVLARLTLGRTLLASEGPDGAEKIERALLGSLAMATEIGYRAAEPGIHRELAALARVRGDDAESKREGAAAERILAEMGARPEQLETAAQGPN